MNKKREVMLKKRKNYFPTTVVTLLLWFLTVFIVLFIEPTIFGIIPLFFILIFLCLLFTFSIVFANARRGLILSISTVSFFLLMFFGIGNVLNLMLILAIALTAEIYFIKQNKS